MTTNAIFDKSTKVANYRQVTFPQNKNWHYQLYFKGIFINERNQEQRTAEGFSTWVQKIDAGVLRTMQNECIAHAQSTLGGSNWIPKRRVASHIIVHRLLTRGRKVQAINTAKWKRKPVAKKKRK
jgi:hypothetical protein